MSSHPLYGFKRQIDSRHLLFIYLLIFARDYLLTVFPLYLFSNPSVLMFHFCPSLCPWTPISLGPPPFRFRWIWRWLCPARGKIRRSRCLCSGCPWSVSRCCWRRCQVTLTRSPKIPFRPWTSSRGICLPWGTDAHHLCRLCKRTTHTHPPCFCWQLLVFVYHLPVLISCCHLITSYGAV